jgi:predicted transcriptional regulator
LEEFIRSRGIKPAHLARESGYSRQHLLRIRFGRMLPSLTCIASIVVTMRRLTRERVRPEQLFEPHVIRSAWRSTRLNELEDNQRAELRAAFGRRTLREFLGGQA